MENFNRSAFGRKTVQTQRPRVDRFVMPRDSFTEMRRRRSWHSHCENEPVDIWHTKHRQKQKYKSYLDKAFGLEPMKNQELKSLEEEYWLQPWPCKPRKKSYLSPADSILDLPNYSRAAFPDLLDWSRKNILVAALGRKYHMYSWMAQNVMGEGLTSNNIQCCKFDPRGELLLLGTDMKRVELHDGVWSKCTGYEVCECSYNQPCSITAADWSPTGNSFITGCSRGVITTFDRTAMLIKAWYGMLGTPVLAVRVSPDTRFVAAAAVNTPVVYLLVWPSLQIHCCLKFNYIVKSIIWHPWRSALLAVGAVTPEHQTSITICDIPTSRLRQTVLGQNHCILDVMMFSQRTGELVLSLWNSDRASVFPKMCSQLVVMSDPYTVVDQSGDGRSGLDRVRTMVFSPDGTKLGMATAEEELIIWNFLPEEKNKKIVNSRKFATIPVYLDELTNGYVLR